VTGTNDALKGLVVLPIRLAGISHRVARPGDERGPRSATRRRARRATSATGDERDGRRARRATSGYLEKRGERDLATSADLDKRDLATSADLDKRGEQRARLAAGRQPSGNSTRGVDSWRVAAR
jgi:hypothetical protein